jgi:hypothetical protein
MSKDVIVLLPGILGSALEKGGKPVWDVTAGAIGNALFSLGTSVSDLALSREGSTGDGVTATHLLTNAHIVPFFWKIDGYDDLSRFIQEKLKLTPGEDFFEFPYDWRLDNRISAKRLAAAALSWLERRRHQYSDARLVLIGHSMGGLVARYFLEVLNGWKDTKMLITLGTPYRGSVKALDFLANGLRRKLGPLKLLDLTKLVQSLPSAYQLLPIYQCVGKAEDQLQHLETLQQKKVGDLDVDRARAGIAFHREIDKAAEANRRQSGYGYHIVPVVGTYQPTFQSALFTPDGVKPLLTYAGQPMREGDGTVPSFSATPIEMSTANVEMFVACPHASLQNFDPVRNQLRAVLEDMNISQLKGVPSEPLSLDMQDAFAGEQEVRVRVRCAAAIDPLQAVVSNVETGATVQRQSSGSPDAEGWQDLNVGILPGGTYRIEVDEADNLAESISDLFVVIDA